MEYNELIHVNCSIVSYNFSTPIRETDSLWQWTCSNLSCQGGELVGIQKSNCLRSYLMQDFRCFELRTLRLFRHEAPLLAIWTMLSFHCSSQINFPFSWKNHKNNFPRRSLRIHEGKIAYSKNKTSFSVRIILETWFVVIGLLLLCCKLLICCYAGKNTPTHNFFLKSINETYWACWGLPPWNSVNV